MTEHQFKTITATSTFIIPARQLRAAKADMTLIIGESIEVAANYADNVAHLGIATISQAKDAAAKAGAAKAAKAGAGLTDAGDVV